MPEEEWSPEQFNEFVDYFREIRENTFGGVLDGIDWYESLPRLAHAVGIGRASARRSVLRAHARVAGMTSSAANFPPRSLHRARAG
jgi:hypothetical protein